MREWKGVIKFRTLFDIISDINEEETNSLHIAGPITHRLHELICELCDFIKIENQWEKEDEPIKTHKDFIV